jgi:hypothetical protein
MKNVVNCLLQGWANTIRHGWIKVGLAACAVIGLTVMSANAATSHPPNANITQLDFVQWLAQLVGVTMDADAKADDYIKWAKKMDWEPEGGWDKKKKLTKQDVAEVLLEALDLQPKKKVKGDAAVRLLASLGITVPDDLSHSGVADFLADYGLQSRLAIIAASCMSPTKPPTKPPKPEKPPKPPKPEKPPTTKPPTHDKPPTTHK